jgi:hypothetical protein
MNGSTDTADYHAALAPMREQLAVDGYGLEAVVSDEHLVQVQVVALDDACEDCLIPKDLFASMISDQLTSAGLPVSDLQLSYPADR